MGNYIDRLKDILAKNTIENEDEIEGFIIEAENDPKKVEAIERFFMNASTSNPFDEGLGYYDLIHHYEDILDEED